MIGRLCRVPDYAEQNEGTSPSGRDSELLISWNLGRPKFVDQPEIRAGKDSFRGGEFLTQVTNRGVVGRLRQMMQTDRQRLGFEIGNQIDLGVVDLPQ